MSGLMCGLLAFCLLGSPLSPTFQPVNKACCPVNLATGSPLGHTPVFSPWLETLRFPAMEPIQSPWIADFPRRGSSCLFTFPQSPQCYFDY
ncbi:hypothetical protein AcV7_005379 [Taiwanofungus camphoratus]|nr:hypothetical protein AcV7_005379 [Antrodia cinnamomea]